jgi:hypothetical protein
MGATLPDDFVVVPDEFGKLSQRLVERRRSDKQKTTPWCGNDCPEIREKFPVWQT